VKLFVAIFAALAVGSGVTTTAQAHFLYHHKHLDLQHRIAYFKRSIEHDKLAIKWTREARYNLRHARGLQSENSYAVALSELQKFHRASLRWHESLLSLYEGKWNALHPPVQSLSISHQSAWLCIHSHEGSWTDGGSPYYGGLQMDMEFQATYGGSLLNTKGTADHWTPDEQMAVAEKAYESGRGFYPWPNSARICGLI
jgi:hypothetical protein